MTITIGDKDRTIMVSTTDSDLNIEDMVGLLQALLVAYGYHIDTVKEIFKNDRD